MAEVPVELPRTANGEPDIDVWLDEASEFSPASRRAALGVFETIAKHSSHEPGLELMEQLLLLKMDIVTVMAGMAFFAVQRGDVQPCALPEKVAAVIDAVLRLSNTNVLALRDAAVLASESKSQADNVRQLLIALIDDPRVAVVKLAERVVALRQAGNGDRAARHVAAREAMEFFAPLAGRLGIRQLKCALEDLAFSYLHPNEYRDVVAKLDGRREVRDRQVEAIRQDLEFRLANAGVDAEVQGRAKHVYSIWKKMIHKDIDFSEVYDVQAVRVLVDRIDACYRVLGVVHTSWPHIPSAFDDYVANPKENGYRSIHTAVIGPAGKTLEVQIRTSAMHEESELGVCAHWAYKDEDAAGRAMQSQKMDWLRSVLEWHEERRTPGAPAADLGAADGSVFAGQDRIFVTTPQGHVLDLAPDATPVDFAYRVHTEIGHRCRAARVDGRIVPLNRRLATGECVEIETSESAQPRRQWLDPALGYVNTSRARSKVQSWFRGQSPESNVEAGRDALRGALQAASRHLPDVATDDFQALARLAGYAGEEELLLAIGVGDELARDLIDRLAPAEKRRPARPPSAARGLIVQGRDRDGLLRDVMAALAAAAVPVEAAAARAVTPGGSATISLQLRVEPAELTRIEEDIRAVPDVLDVYAAASA